MYFAGHYKFKFGNMSGPACPRRTFLDWFFSFQSTWIGWGVVVKHFYGTRLTWEALSAKTIARFELRKKKELNVGHFS